MIVEAFVAMAGYSQALPSIAKFVKEARVISFSQIHPTEDFSALSGRCKRLSLGIMLVAEPLFKHLVFLNALRRENPAMRVIIVSEYDNVQMMLESIRSGASAFIQLPCPQDTVLEAVQKTVRHGGFLPDTLLPRLLRQVHENALHSNARWRLSRRETQVITCLVQGLSDKEIADHLRVSLPTVLNTKNRMFRKLKVNCRTDAIREYMDLSLQELQNGCQVIPYSGL